MRWTHEEDKIIVAYFDAIPVSSLSKDINRSEISLRRRAKHLKETGAWSVHEEIHKLELKAGILCGRLDPDMIETIHGVSLEDLGLGEACK